MTATLVVVIGLLVLLALGAPVAFALGIAGSAGLLMLGGPTLLFGIMKTTPLSSVSNYEFLTIPMFLLMAEVLIISDVADDMFDAINAWVGWVRGGLAVATALTGAAFGAISGSSTASAATLASTSIPAMIRQGYERKLANGVASISGTLAMLIPPSIALALYAILADQSVAKLLIAGVVPGLLVTLTIIFTVYFLVWRDPSRAPAGPRTSRDEKLNGLKVAVPFLALFMAVTGIIYIGVATPTEAAALGAFGAILIAMQRRRLSVPRFMEALMAAGRTSAMISMIIVCAHVFGYFLTMTQTTQHLVGFVAGLQLPSWVTMLIVMGIYLVLGMFMDQIAILILTVPIVLPLIVALGYDPVWFGVIVVLMAEVGMVTPPVGLNVFVVARYTNSPVAEVFGGVYPHVVAHLILVAVMIVFPGIILWLPSMMSS